MANNNDPTDATDLSKDLSGLTPEQFQELKKIQEARKKAIEEYEKQIKSLSDSIEKLTETERARMEANNNITRQLENKRVALNEEEEALLAKYLAEQEMLEKVNALKKEQAERVEEASDKLKNYSKNIQRAVTSGQDLGTATSEASKKVNSLQGILSETFGKGRGGFLGQAYQSIEAISEFGSQFKAALDNVSGPDAGKAGRLRSTFQLLWNSMTMAAGPAMFAMIGFAGKLALEFDNLSKQIGKTTGFGNKFGDTIKNVGKEALDAGVSFREASEALGTLAKELSAFDPNAKEINTKTTKMVALMSEIGVSASSSVKSINIMNRSMGMSVERSTEMTAQLSLMGKEIGIVSEKMVSGFVAAMDRLAVYGNNSIRIFKELAAAAKASGLEISSLTAISEQFDTFDKASTAAAKLNAHLGLNIDMMRMMHSNEADIVKEIQRQTKARFGSINSLDKHTQRMITNALGFKKVSDAQAFLNMNMAEAQKYSSGMEEQARVQEELTKLSGELVPIMKKLGLFLLKVFFLFEPVIAVFEFFIDLLNSANIGTGGFANALSFLDAKLYGSLTVMDAIKGALSFIGVGFAILATGIFGPWGAAIGGAIAALGGLWRMFTKRGSPPLYDMPRYFAEGFDILGNSLSKVGGFLGKGAKGITGMLDGLWGIWHKPGSDMLYELPRYFAEGFTMIADSITSTVDSLSRFISLVTEFAKVDFDGFIAVRTEGGSTSMVMGSEGVLKSFNEGKLTVDVKMPEIKMPPININVLVDSARFENAINAVLDERLQK